jgi:hypothetical protein
MGHAGVSIEFVVLTLCGSGRMPFAACSLVVVLRRCWRAASVFLLGAMSRETAHTGHWRRRDARTQPVMCKYCHTNECHHGNCGLNCGGRPHANQNRTGNVTRWK